MSKPDDIPQDVWIAATTISAFELDGYVETAIVIARAILAAKAEERRGCLAALEVERDENASGEGEVYIAERMISAIRKREG